MGAQGVGWVGGERSQRPWGLEGTKDFVPHHFLLKVLFPEVSCRAWPSRCSELIGLAWECPEHHAHPNSIVEIALLEVGG